MRVPSLSIPAFALATLAAAPALATGLPEVTLSDCTEAVGLDVIPAANARPLVPDEFELLPADEAGQLAVIIVRVVECGGIAVNNLPPTPGRFMHVGISLANGEPDADANNYQLWFATNHIPLRLAMAAAGVEADLDAIEYDFDDATGALDIEVSPWRAPDFTMSGSAFLLDIPRSPFIAAWFAEGRRGLVRMRGEYEGVLFGVSDAVLTTPADSALAALAGRDTLGFAVLNTYNDVPDGEVAYTFVDADDCRPRRRR
ncbi:MAG: hypothetical protein H6701_07905 [Myxococcales bacterium]|nr:hypothetical protein [Myxococcales bacterium]MCB9551439.1 hypothetical protein [Myxococcales bacterium]